MVDTGVRASDFCTVTFKQLGTDIEDNTFIQYTSQKTKKLTKSVLSPETSELLKKWENLRTKGKIKASDPRIFPFTTQRLRQILTNIRIRAQIKRPIRPHDFCETTMTRMGQKGIDPGLVAQQVGRDPITVQRHYQKYSLGDKAKAVEKSLSWKSVMADLEEE